jgi:hypothetical protein
LTDKLSGGDILYGVDCDAVHCKYHGHDNRCYADNIIVESPNALKKAETFCGTFAPRPTNS